MNAEMEVLSAEQLKMEAKMAEEARMQAEALEARMQEEVEAEAPESESEVGRQNTCEKPSYAKPLLTCYELSEEVIVISN